MLWVLESLSLPPSLAFACLSADLEQEKQDYEGSVGRVAMAWRACCRRALSKLRKHVPSVASCMVVFLCVLVVVLVVLLTKRDWKAKEPPPLPPSPFPKWWHENVFSRISTEEEDVSASFTVVESTTASIFNLVGLLGMGVGTDGSGGSGGGSGSGDVGGSGKNGTSGSGEGGISGSGDDSGSGRGKSAEAGSATNFTCVFISAFLSLFHTLVSL